GFEGHILPFNWLALTYTAKAMLGANLVEREVFLKRGDGFVGFDTHDNLTRLAHAYEAGVSADILLLESMRLRVGYNVFWLNNIATAVGQIDYNLANTRGTQNVSDSTYYHGPMLELQILF